MINLTNEQILKVLTCHSESYGCPNCPLRNYDIKDCSNEIVKIVETRFKEYELKIKVLKNKN